MARRHKRGAVGVLERTDGVRVEVKNPTVWRHLEQQTVLLGSLQSALSTLSADRDRKKAAFDQLCAHWWVRLGARLGIVRGWVDEKPPAPAKLVQAPNALPASAAS